MITFGLLLAGTVTVSAPLDQNPYERMVEILKVQVAPAKEPRRHELEITFNVVPDMPKGVVIFFGLERNQIPVNDESSAPVIHSFKLENDNRKNIKVRWTPKARLTCDKYMVKTSVPLPEQTEEVKKALQTNNKRFPEKYDPWPWTHTYMEFAVGTPEQEAAEYKEVTEFVEKRIEEALNLNNEAMDEFEKVAAGQAHVKAGKLDVDSLRKFMGSWMTRMAKVQGAIGEVVLTDPGLYDAKYLQVHANLVALGQMIGKRIRQTELKKVVEKNGVAMTAFNSKLPAVAGFMSNYSFSTSAAEIDRKQKDLKKNLWYAAPGRKPEEIYPEEKEEESAADAADSKDAKKDKDGADAAKDDGSKNEDPPKDDNPPKKDTKKTGKKDSKKKK
jgi:hypothetical protein